MATSPLLRVGLTLTLLPCLALARPMGEDEARHLLNRTGFGPDRTAIQQFATLDREQAVDTLLSGVLTQPVTTPDPDVLTFVTPRTYREADETTKKQLRQQERERELLLRSWWYGEMLTTPSPLTERLVLFWHNHFTSSLEKVKSARLMYDQNQLFRREALGNFRTLLHDVSKDPAMLVYLDTARSRKDKPNENYAREVMELFTLGEGHYAEQDIREGARALTGWTVDPDTGAFLYNRRQHDDGDKTILGRQGRFDGDQFLDILLAQPAASELVTRKLWREFVSPTPDEAEVQRLANQFRRQDYQLKPLLRALLLTPQFWDPANRGDLVKSPVELIVGTLRQFRPQVVDMRPFLYTARNLGQDLFNPPNVKGWPGGNDWINTGTLLARKQFLEQLLRGREMPILVGMTPDANKQVRQAQQAQRLLAKMNVEPDAWLKQFPPGPAGRQTALRTLLPLPQDVPATDDPDEWVKQVLLSPAYQLK